MCTVLIAHNVLPDYPIFLAANRDEFYRRPSDGPRLRGTAPRRWFGPSDLRENGTWIGVNEQQIFAVITNRSDLELPTSPEQQSRGLLVRSILESESVDEAIDRWEQFTATGSQPFNFVFGAVGRLHVGLRDERHTTLRSLARGVHAFSNFGSPDAEVDEVSRALDEWHFHRERRTDVWKAAREILSTPSSRDRPGLEKDHGDRGTVSSTILGIASSGQVRYLHAEGRPSKADFVTTDPVEFESRRS